MSIPTSTWASELSDHIVSLKLGFASKRQHDHKGIVDFHLKKNHFKTGYTHEETPYHFIYQGVDTFSKVFENAKSKEEQSHILQYQKEIRDRVRHYRAMELDIQEKVMKDTEEKEAQDTAKEALAIKNKSMETSSSIEKGKGPMK